MQCSEPLQLTDHAASDAIPNWSAEDRSVYFGSQRSGQWQIWRIPAKGNRPEPADDHEGRILRNGVPGLELAVLLENDSAQVMGVWRKPVPGTGASHDPGEDPGRDTSSLEHSGQRPRGFPGSVDTSIPRLAHRQPSGGVGI